MKKEFVPYELALKLKDLGFDEKCVAWFNNNERNELIYDGKSKNSKDFTKNSKHCTAPLWQQAQTWLREEHDIHIVVNFSNIQNHPEYHTSLCKISESDVGVENKHIANYFYFKTYEEALKTGLQEALKLI